MNEVGRKSKKKSQQMSSVESPLIARGRGGVRVGDTERCLICNRLCKNKGKKNKEINLSTPAFKAINISAAA